MAKFDAERTKRDAKITELSRTTGASLNTQDVVLLYTASFFINLAKSQKGCNIFTPFLPAQKAFVFFIIPIIKNGTNKSISIFKITIIITDLQILLAQ